MKVFVAGVGRQGRAVVHDLERCELVGEIVAADQEVTRVERELERLGCRKARAVALDVTRPEDLEQAVRASGAAVVVCMVPPAHQLAVARAALAAGAHFVSSSYTGALVELDAQARAEGLCLLPEMGFDPGIDLLMARAAVAELDEVIGLRTYGGGIPERAAADNPLRYKITWTFDGVLSAYRRPARLRRDGLEVSIPGEDIFREEHTSVVELPGLGALEAYPNGDALRYAPIFGLGPELRDLGRFAVRWPGHCAFWRTLVELGFLKEESIAVDSTQVSPVRFLARLLEPSLGYAPDERDLAVIRVDAWGKRDGAPRRVVLDLVDRRDLTTGLFAMNRAVGYTAAIGAQMVLRGEIEGAGLLSPARDVPIERVLAELRARGMDVVRRADSPATP